MSAPTLRRWADSGQLRCISTPGGKRLYESKHVRELLEPAKQQEAKTNRVKIAYARVSSAHQKEDLERQVEDLKRDYPGHEIVRDVGSGLNWNRTGFKALLERCHEGLVEEIVVRHRDRLARFGVELLEWMFKKFEVRLVVQSRDDDEASRGNDARELSEDLLSIVTVFVAKNNGRRAQENRRLRRAQQTDRGARKAEEEVEQEVRGTKRIRERGDGQAEKATRAKKDSVKAKTKGAAKTEEARGGRRRKPEEEIAESEEDDLGLDQDQIVS